ncbi:MAG: laminin B domain-containing protein [Phycisphaerae bacterium]
MKPEPALNFTAIANNPSVNDILRWDPDGPFGPIPERILLAGGLTPVTNTTFNEMISAYDPVAGTWTAVGGGFRPGSGVASAAAVMPNGDVIVAGQFAQIGDVPGGGPLVNANLIARWDGTQWNAMGSGIQPTSGFGVFDMAVTPAGELVVVGAQAGAGGVASRYVTKWTGTQWVAMNNGLNIDTSASLARTVAVNANGEVFMGGLLAGMGNIVRWDGTQWLSMGAGLQDTFQIIIDPADQRPIAITNGITGVPQAQQSRVAKWNGSAWQPLGTPLGNAADATVAGGSRIMVASGSSLFELDRVTGTWVPISNAPQMSYLRLMGLPNGDIITTSLQGPQRMYRIGLQPDCPLVASTLDSAAGNTADWDLTNRTGTYVQDVDNTTAGRIQPTEEAVTRIVNLEPIYYNAIGSWLGDRTGAYGGYIRVETTGLQTPCANPGESPAHYDVRLVGQIGPGVTRSLVRRTADFATLRSRRVINVPLTADGWRVDSTSGVPVTEQEFYDTLKNVRSLQFSVNAPGPLCESVNFAIEDVAIYKQAPITSFNWNQGDYQWRWTGDGDTAQFFVENDPAGGGQLRSNDAFQAQWRNYVAPQTLFGGFANKYGGIFSFKMRTSTTVENENFPLVRIEARDIGTLLYFDPNPPAPTLTPYFVPLSASPVDASGRGWIVENLSPPLTEAFVRRVLDNVTAISIRGEFSREVDQTWLDDVAIATTFSNPGCDSIDFNNNTVFPEEQDVIDFFIVLSGGECSPGNTCSDIDFNNNQVFPEEQDVIDFFNVLAGAECV